MIECNHPWYDSRELEGEILGADEVEKVASLEASFIFEIFQPEGGDGGEGEEEGGEAEEGVEAVGE